MMKCIMIRYVLRFKLFCSFKNVCKSNAYQKKKKNAHYQYYNYHSSICRCCSKWSVVNSRHFLPKISLNTGNDRSILLDATGKYLNTRDVLLVTGVGSTILVSLT